MDNDESQLNKKGLLLNKKTLTDLQSPIIRIGNDAYILRKLYILTKDYLNNDMKNKSISFYLKTKMKINKNMSYRTPLDDDIIIDSYHSLIMLVATFCELKEINHYKIIIFNSDLNSIEGDEQLLNYRDIIIYAKINQNIKKNESEKNNNFRSIKNILNKRMLSITQRDNQGNIIFNHNKSFFSSVKSSFLNLKKKKNYNINNHLFEKSLRSTIAKNTSFSIDKNKNNIFNSKNLFKKKLNRISLKYSYNSFEFRKEENDTNNNSYKVCSNQFDNIINSKKKINEISSANINDSLRSVKLSKSKSELEFFGQKNQRINQKIFDAEKLFQSFNDSKNDADQVMSIDKTFNKRQNYFYNNNFFKTIFNKYNYSNFLRKKKTKSLFDLRKRKSFYTNHSEEIKKIKINKSSLNQNLLDKNRKEFTNLKTIFKYLKYPKQKEQEKMKKMKEEMEDDCKEQMAQKIKIKNTGAALTLLEVKTPAAAHGTSE